MDTIVRVGDRVRTAHGPSGRDYGTVTAVLWDEDVREAGRPVVDAAGRPIRATWCEVRFDGHTDGGFMLDHRSDGHGRLLLV